MHCVFDEWIYQKNCPESQSKMYPNGLRQISIKYLGGPNFLIRFKPCTNNDDSMEYINKHHAIIREGARYSWATFLIDLPIPVHDAVSNISWNISLKLKKFPNEHVFIGIVPDTFTHFGWTVWAMGPSASNGNFGIHGRDFQDTDADYDIIKWNGKKCEDKEKVIIGKSNYKSEDIVHCEYNGRMKEFKMSKVEDGELICCFRIKDASDDFQYFYPAISLLGHGDSIQIVWT